MSDNGWAYAAGRPGRKPWHRRIADTWTRLAGHLDTEIPPNVVYDYHRRPLFGHYQVGYNVFGPYERPILDATGGGDLYARQLPPYHPNSVVQQGFTPVGIAGDGAELHGSFNVLPLVNVSQPGPEIVSVQTVNGVTNLTLAPTTVTPASIP